ncbi:MAG: amino acid ABC transporter substrate-binding protein [Bacillota bacterium]
MKVSRSLRLLSLVLVLALALGTLAGCSGKAARKTILVGASLSLSGNLARNGLDQQRGYELWREAVNAAGGINGKQVELKVYDDSSDPQTAAKLYEKLITDDKVDLLIGPYGSNVTMAASTVAEKYKMAMITPGASSKEIWERGYKYTFQMLTPARYQLHQALQLAKDKGYTTVAIVSADSAFPRDLANGAEQSAKDLGLNLVFKEEYPEKATDLSSLVMKLKRANPDVLIAGSYLPDSVLLTRQMKEAKFAPKMIQFGPNGPALPDFAKSLGNDANNLLGVSQWEPSAAFPGSKEFVKAFTAKYPGEMPSYSVAGAYAAGQLLQMAIEKAGSLKQDQIVQALYAMDVTTIFGRFKVDQTGTQVAHAAVLIQVQNGHKKVVYPADAAETAPVLPFPGWSK